MNLYSPAQILAGGKVRKTRIRQRSRSRRSSVSLNFDVQFLKALGKVWLIVLPCLFAFYSVTCAMVNNVAETAVNVENMNYQLLTSNLELRGEARMASASDVVKDRAVALGLYEHERGQLLVYKINKNYFSYQ